jgi:hypothetical protein
LRRSGCLFFACVLRQAAAAAVKKQENRPLKKNKENALYRPAVRSDWRLRRRAAAPRLAVFDQKPTRETRN